MEAADPRIRYSLCPPGHMPGGGALKGAADQSGPYQGVLPQSGAYLLQVNLMPEPAGAKGKYAPVARYRLHVAIGGRRRGFSSARPHCIAWAAEGTGRGRPRFPS